MDVRGKGRGSGLTGRERGGILDWLFGKGVRGNGLAVWERGKGNGLAVWERGKG